MPTNANTFNSRVTSEALEAKYRQVFPAQGGSELVQDLYASGVIQPVIDFSSVAEGSVLSQNLQTAWDFSTGHAQVAGATTTLINNTGFWLVDVCFATRVRGTTNERGIIRINDGLGTKIIRQVEVITDSVNYVNQQLEEQFVVFLRTGDSLQAVSSAAGNVVIDASWRQIADLYGNLVNPLGYTFS